MFIVDLSRYRRSECVINREGYHDKHDPMENIDLDYGAALAAIAIESPARVANTTLSDWQGSPKPMTSLGV